MAGGAAGRRMAAALVVVMALCPACGCARVRQWREARASAAAAASASAADAALYERLRNIVPDDVDVCGLMSAGDMEAILGQQLETITFSRSSYEAGTKIWLQCQLDLFEGTPYEVFPANALEIGYGFRPRDPGLMEEVSAYPDVSGVREVSADGLEGQWPTTSHRPITWIGTTPTTTRSASAWTKTTAPRPRTPPTRS